MLAVAAVLSAAALFAAQNLIVDSDADKTPLSPEFRLAEGAKQGKLEQFTEDLTWNKCLRMELTDIPTDANGKHNVCMSLQAGGDGKTGFPVEGGAKYAFSFEAKGKAPRLLVVWKEWDASGKARKVRTAMHVIKLTDDWVAYRGTVAASPDAVKGALILQFWGTDKGNPANWGNAVGDWVMIDKVSVAALPKVKDIWTKPEAPIAIAQVPTWTDPAIPYRPDELAGTNRLLRIRAAVNERAVLPVAVGNLTDEWEEYRVTIDCGYENPAPQFEYPMFRKGLVAADGTRFGMERLTIRRGVKFRDSNAKEHGSRYDILAKLDETGTLPVPAKEAGLVWIQVDCRGSKPGVYRGELAVTPLSRGGITGAVKGVREPGVRKGPFAAMSVADSTERRPVEIEILPFALEEPTTMAMVGFRSVWADYQADFANDYDVVMHQITPWFFDCTFNSDGTIAARTPRSFLLPHIRFVRDHVKRIGSYPRVMVAHSAYEVFKRAHWPKDLFAFDSPEYWRAFREWFRYVNETMRAEGFAPDDYVVQLFDEPNPKKISPDEALRMYREAKTAVPDARLLQTNGERIYFDALSPYVDLWFFSQHVFGDAQIMTYPTRLAAEGKVASMYACGTEMRQDLYRYYRMIAWKAAACGGPYVPLYQLFEQWPSTSFLGATEGGVSYDTGSEMVPSIRLENLREGMTDIRYLRHLEALIAADAKSSAAVEAKAFVDRALREIPMLYPHESTRADAFRAACVDYILKLEK